MTFSKKNVNQSRSFVFLNGEELELVTQFKYLGVVLDSNLTFKKHIKKVTNTIKFNMQNFKQIRPFISTDAAKSYLHCMIFSHIDYCFTVWSFAAVTALKPIEQVYKRSIKIFDRKPFSHHICSLLDKYKFLNFNHLKTFKNCCLIYKVLNGSAPPPLGEFIKKRSSNSSTRSLTRGDCEVQFRKSSFSQNVLSVKGCGAWNSLPTSVRDSTSIITFKKRLKEWLFSSQTCDH